MKTIIFFIALAFPIYAFSMSISDIKRAGENSSLFLTTFTDYQIQISQKKYDRAENTLKSALNQDQFNPGLNLLYGYFWETQKKYYWFPYMSSHYYKYLTLKKFNAELNDEIIFKLIEYFISESIYKKNTDIVQKNDLRGTPCSLNLNELINRVKNKKSSLYFLHLGLISMIDKNYSDAVTELSKVQIEEVPYTESKWVFNNLGFALIKEGKFVLAERPLNIAIFIDPANKHSLVNLASIYYSRGEFDEAINEYNLALNIDPKYKIALEGRKECVEGKKAYKNLIFLAEKSTKNKNYKNAIKYYYLSLKYRFDLVVFNNLINILKNMNSVEISDKEIVKLLHLKKNENIQQWADNYEQTHNKLE